MTLRSQKSQTDDGKAQTEEGLLDLREPVQTTPPTPKGMPPGNGPFHEPAIDAQTAAMFPAPFAHDRQDPQPTQHLPHRLGIVPGVPLQAVWFWAFGAWLAADGGHIRENLENLRDLVDVGGRHRTSPRDPLGVGQDGMFAAGFAAIRGV